jgi:hypothetical protein
MRAAPPRQPDWRRRVRRRRRGRRPPDDPCRKGGAGRHGPRVVGHCSVDATPWVAGPVDGRKRPGGEKGTAPVGGTTGAVDAPSSGGEELVRRSARPRRGANGSILNYRRPVRNFPPEDLRDARHRASTVTPPRRGRPTVERQLGCKKGAWDSRSTAQLPLRERVGARLLRKGWRNKFARAGREDGTPQAGCHRPRPAPGDQACIVLLSQRDKPVTIGPPVDCPRVGSRCDRGGRRTRVRRRASCVPRGAGKRNP